MKASILKNTNKAITSTDVSLGSLRENTMIKFGNDSIFYEVGSCKPILIIKDFTNLAGNKILIQDELGISFSALDTVSISYKEHELQSVIKLTNKGIGYKPFDVLYITSGVVSKNLQTNAENYTKLVVSEVNAAGEITQILIQENGSYIKKPADECPLIGGSGQGASALVDYKISDKRTIAEKTIINLEKVEKGTIITFDSPIENGVEVGKISVDKWEIFISSLYSGDSKINETIEFIRDFSPNLQIPLFLKGNQSPEYIYNLAIKKIDSEIGQLKKTILKLESGIQRLSSKH